MLNEATYLDLTHPLTQHTPTYPGAHELPPQIETVASIENQGYALSNLSMSLHVGTHIDAPAHMIAGGKKLSDYPVEHFIGPAILIDVRGKEIIEPESLANRSLDSGCIVLFYTGWDMFFYAQSERYFKEHPTFVPATIDLLIKKKIKMIGFDLPGPDRWPFDLHKLLLKNDVLIIENLTHLDRLVDCAEIKLYALPLPICADGAQARVVAQVKRQ